MRPLQYQEEANIFPLIEVFKTRYHFRRERGGRRRDSHAKALQRAVGIEGERGNSEGERGERDQEIPETRG